MITLAPRAFLTKKQIVLKIIRNIIFAPVILPFRLLYALLSALYAFFFSCFCIDEIRWHLWGSKNGVRYVNNLFDD